MGRDTQIEWTNDTWNPWQGCAKVSPGCAHCYMYRDKRRYGQDGSIVVRSSKTTFYEPLKRQDPSRIFTCSWSDFFIDEADPWRSEAWDVIRRTPHHTYQILTKRPERMLAHLPEDWGEGWPHVWLGVSVENARWAARRLPLLQAVPASVRFLSAEPLLTPIPHLDLQGIQWVICGGESGPGHRPVEPAWVRSIRDQCQQAGVAFFFKQWGGARPKSGGKLLDGREWCDYPQAQETRHGQP